MNPKPTTNSREYRSSVMRDVRVSKNDDGSNTVSGYAVLYNSLSVDLGGFVETIAPGALTRTLADSPDVLCLRDHQVELLLGRTISGTLILTEDSIGLNFVCQLPNTTTGNDLAESLRRGDIDSCSFGFSCANDTWTQDAQGCVIRCLLDIDLFEVSVVSFPAYPETSAALRSAPIEIRSQIESHNAPPIPPVEPSCITANTEQRQRVTLRHRLLSLNG
ncbi:HK97 family phage prohead protease [Granulicella mallensis]|uniref:Prohead serine protease domain-containing protein n=1 Tax=Granulicella mallensis TaxID=940614 RepID=A0A7W8EBZ1_9BACT|nr:HK97 family phage prohead protease [Granulicella mallensis]MBB5066151.1 hypothetical protein [Granulicella mallensis]